MKKRFTSFLAALALLAFFIPSFTAMSKDIVVTLDNIGAGLGSTANTTEATTDITATGTTDVYTLNYYQCKKQGNAMLMTKSVSPYISNHTAMPGKIKSVEVFINSGASTKTTYNCAFSTTECHSAVSGIGAVNITGGNSHTFSNLTGGVINVQGEYFCITLGNANNGQVLKLVITCENSSSTAVATTTTIDDTGITNTDIKDGTAAGSLSASVTYGSPATSVPSASVSWRGNNDAVATIDASTGAVTLHSMGTVKFTATYAGVEGTYQASSADYNMTVTDSRYVVSDLTFTAAYGSGPGTADDEVEWTVTSDGSESSFDNTKGIHYGTSNAAVQYIQLSTSDITEPIAKVIVNASTASGVSATVGVTIDGSAFGGDAQTLSSSAADYTFASSTNAQGEIIVTVTKSSSTTGALYVKSVKVTYLAPAVKAPNIDVPAEFVGSTTATITCETEGATIYYSYDNSTWTEYTEALTITETKTIYAKAVKGEDESAVVSKTTTKTTPTITVSTASLTGFTYVVDNGPSTTKTVSVSGANLTANISLSLGDNSNYEMCLTSDGSYTNSLSLSPTTGTVAATTVYVRLKAGLAVGNSYSGTITLTSTEATNKTVSLSGSVTEPVIDYADLTTGPFKYTGNGTGTLPAGLSTTGTSTYTSQPQIKFDNTDDNVILKTGSAPGAIVFDIAGKFSSGTWTGTFDLQTSEDGTNYSNLAEFTSLSGETQTVFFTNTNPSVRYIKWVFTSKTSGYNVAIGNIIVTAEQSITNGTSTFTPEANHVYIVNNGSTLILDGDYSATLTNASNLIIEDGGKLITHYAVAATVKKEVAAAANWGTTGDSYTPDGWYFIASPVNTTSYATALTTGTEEDYDLYMLDWATKNWLNKKDDANSIAFGDGFTRGTGYLYASQAGNTLSVSGEIKPLTAADTAQVVLKTNGWNLIGNPLTCKVTVDKAFSELTNASAVTNQVAGSAINPCQGIAVYGKAGDVVTFAKAASQNAAAPSNNSSLQMTLAKTITSRGDVSTKVVDNAVVSFKESKCMPKFNMIGGNTKLFIPQDDEEYSIVFSDRQGDVPLYFKANETGTYTISFAGDEMSLNGIYLIDILAEEEIDLSVEPSYTFIGSPADRAARFKIVFRTGFENSPNDIFAYQNGSDIVVCGEGELQIFDVMGRMVSRQRVNGVETVNAMPYGVYIFKLNGMTQKIVVR